MLGVFVQSDVQRLLVFKFLLKYVRLAHVRMKKSILAMKRRSSGLRSSVSQTILLIRCRTVFFSSMGFPSSLLEEADKSTAMGVPGPLSSSEDFMAIVQVMAPMKGERSRCSFCKRG